MATLAELVVKIGANVSGLKKGVEEAKGRMAELDRAMNAALPASKAVAGGLLGIGVAAAGASLKGIQLAASMEQSKIAFGTMLGSAQEADSFVRQLWDFAAKTPFEFEGLQNSSRMLLAFGFQAKEIIPIMTAVGNAVSGLGGGAFEIDRVVRALGQMQAKGKVSAEEMMQLAELGIPAWDMLAKTIGVSVPEAMKMAEKGTIPAATAIKGFVEEMNKRFPDMMAKQSQTLLGMWSTAKDNVSGVLRVLGEEIIKTFDLKPKLASAIEALGQLSSLLQAEGLKGALQKLFPPEVQDRIVLIAGAIAGALAPAVWSLASGVIAATLPLIQFMVYGAALAALAWTIYRNWEPIKGFFADTWQTIAATATTIWSSISTFFAGLWTGITGSLVGAWNGIKTAAVATWTAIADFFRNWWGTILLGIVTGGVGLLVIVLVKNWDRIKGLTAQAWQAIKDAIAAAAANAYQAVVGAMIGLPGWLAGLWEDIQAAASNAWAAFRDSILGLVAETRTGIINGLDAAWDWIRNLPTHAVQWGADIIRAFARGIASISIPVPTFSVAFRPGPLGIDIPSIDVGVHWRSLAGLIPALAEGGLILRPTLAMVGERGPEAVVPLDRGPIGNTINITITGNTISSDYDVDHIADRLVKRLRLAGVRV